MTPQARRILLTIATPNRDTSKFNACSNEETCKSPYWLQNSTMQKATARKGQNEKAVHKNLNSTFYLATE